MRAKKYLSLLLVVVMMLSLFPVNAFALGGGSDIGIGGGFGRDIGDDEVRDFDPSNLIEDAEEPVDLFSGVDTENGIQVTVESRNNALPTMAEVRVTPVDPLDGIEIEPEEPVNVKISAPELTDRTGLQVVHIPDADGEEEAQPNTVELIGEDEMSIPVGTNEIAFKANSFSVYVIVDGETGDKETFRRTYKFTTDGNTPFEFYNKAGKKVSEQIVKKGDTLEEVGLPYSASHTFQNWVVVSSTDENVRENDAVNLPMSIEDDLTADTEVVLKPAYGDICFVTFHANDLPSDPDIIQTKKIVVKGEKVVIGDVLAPDPDESHIFYGWTKDSNGSDDNAVVVYDKDNKLVRTTEYTAAIDFDIDLYPYFVEAYWLRFVAGETGSRASYVPAQFARANDVLTDLPVSTRIGYTFDGWYTGSQDEETGVITYGTQVTNGSGKVINPASGLKLTGETVLYGHWTANSNATYSVVIWRQKVSDKKDAADDEKTYDYAESYVGTGTTDEAVTASNDDKSKSYEGFHFGRVVQNSETIRADGSTVINVYYDRDLMAINFYYQADDAPSGAADAYTYTETTSNDGTQYGVLADGSYVEIHQGDVSVPSEIFWGFEYGGSVYRYQDTFYTRAWTGSYYNGHYEYTETEYNGADNLPDINDGTAYYTKDLGDDYHLRLYPYRTYAVYNWYYLDEEGNQVPYTDTRYTRSAMSGYPKMVTWTGLYGQSFDFNGYEWPAEYKWNEKSSGTGGTVQTFLTDFVNPNNPYNLYDRGKSGTSVIYHYKQGLDGIYHQTNTADYTYRYTAYGSGGSFHFQDKFEGFTVKSYNTGNNGFNSNGGNNTDLSNTPSTYPLHVYHERNKVNLYYWSTPSAQSTTMQEVGKREGIYYEAPLNDYDLSLEDLGLEERDHYTFTGWYADETCTKKFNFNSIMPNANVTVYAGWEPVSYQILIDPDGGVITPDVGSTYFWEDYGSEDKVGRYEVKRPYIEDPNGDFVYVYVDGRNDPDGNIKNRTATYVPFAEYTPAEGEQVTRYRLINPATDPTYSLVGWYEVDFTTGETTSTPYNFDAEIEGPVWIRAVWNLGGDYGIQYNATAKVTVKEGSDPVEVSGSFTPAEVGARYADGATFVVDAPPTNITPEGYVFDGWEIVEPDANGAQGAVLDDNNGAYYQPGDKVELNAAAWSRNKTIHFRAHYTAVFSSEDPVGVTYLQFRPNFPTDATVKTGEQTEAKYYPLNTAIDLGKDEFVPTNYKAGGYKLIGWSQDPNAKPVVHAQDAALGKIVFGLKDVVGVDGLNPTEKVTVTVTLPGADEDEIIEEEQEVDCNVLYAIWAPEYFYVFHSSTGDLEAVRMPVNETGTFDLTSKVPEGYLYGGYYYSYLANQNFATEDNKTDAKAADTLKVNITTDTYNGSALKKDNARYWTKAHAFTKTVSEDMGGGIGTAMTPKAEFVYYLKEVPNTYLASRISYVYDWADDYKLVNLYLLTAVDDNYYSKVQFEVVVDNNPYAAKLVNSFAITQRNSNQQFVNRATDFNGVTRGYVGYADVTSDLLKVGSFTMKPQWVTLDGVTVDGTARTFVITELTKDGITAK